MTRLTPRTLDELCDAVRATPRLLPVGARTKPRMSQVSEDVMLVSMCALSGIVEYDPSEFTFTALAGTPVREIAAALVEREQYLPFDPMLLEAGATLGGTVAAGLSGPGRFRFGGVRDFILGVRFVDGAGRLLRMGGKVVKNAAGFDLPKFFVGSRGRFGVLAELTFKVFPRPASKLTLRLTLSRIDDAPRALAQLANTRYEPDALDLLPDGQTLLLRLAGPESALTSISREILAHWPGEPLSADTAAAFWADICEFQWADSEGELIKVAMTTAQLPALQYAASQVAGARLHVSAGGDVAYISSLVSFDENLRTLGLRGLTLRGKGPLRCGVREPQAQIARAVKDALDPHQRFPPCE